MSGAGALFMVRAVVADPAEREPFDRWYEREHLPEALAAFDRRWGDRVTRTRELVRRVHTPDAGR